MRGTLRPAHALVTAAALTVAACTASQTGVSQPAPSAHPGTTVHAVPALAFAGAPPSSVAGNVVALDLAAQGVRIVPPDGDTSGATGHYHLFIDRDPPPPGAPIPKEPGIVHTAESHVTLPGLTAGTHHIAVVLGDGAHRRLGDAVVQTDIAVRGPSVTASAPVTVNAGDPVTIELHVEGIRLTPADGDTSGGTGHLHLFVDRSPTAAGQPIPKEDGIVHTSDTSVTLPPMAPGDHTVWVVVGNGAHVPLDPPVMAKVTFTVQAVAAP
jgi:hypothetical protein